MRRLIRPFVALLGITVLSLIASTVIFWAPDVPVDTLKARWAPAPSSFVPIEGMSVHLRDEGPRDDPMPLLLLHGTSASLHTWEGWVAALRTTRRVISIDLPGFGLTGPAPDRDYRLERYTRFVGATLDALNLKQVVLAGNSLGGQIAWATAVAMPHRVSRLILVDAAGYPSQATSVPIGFRLARIPGLGLITENVLPRALIESSVKNVYGHPERVTPDRVDLYFDLARRAGNRQALAQRFQQMKVGASADQIAQVRVPTLILWGAQDRLIPPESAHRFKRDIAGSRLVIFDDLGHVPHEEDAQRTVQAVLPFISTTAAQ